MSVDTMGDFLTAIRNALMVSKRTVIVPFSNMRFGVAQVLKEEGYIRDFKKAVGERNRSFLELYLKYVGGESVIHEIKRISRPGRRHYSGLKGVTPVIGGLGISILSTNQGIIADKQARKMSVGGEVICHVW
ncbi:30S ribosomal protein S8 [Candidatus Dependentiae bacterium]|nr:30S ribosomal protein S8 [Candidatus Dependentiae bacterium]